MRPRDHLVARFVLAYGLSMVVLSFGSIPLPRDQGGIVGAWNTVRLEYRFAAEPWAEVVGVKQRWRMFRKVNTTATRVEIAVRVDGAWTDVFVERSPDAGWNRSRFEQHRWREFSNHLRGKRKKREWRVFVPWVAERLFAEHPDADAVRVRVMKTRLPSADKLQRKRRLRFRKEVVSEVVERASP